MTHPLRSFACCYGVLLTLLSLTAHGQTSTTLCAGSSVNLGSLITPPAGSTVTWSQKPQATAIAAGGAHSLALLSNGAVLGWGGNGNDQLIVPASPATAIAAGSLHSLALLANGSVVGWGGNGNGQLSVPASATPATAIAVGDYHSFALLANGSIVGWGNNSSGQITVPASATPATAIAGGGYHNLALLANGSVVGWGDNSQRQSAGYDAQPVASPVVSPTATQTYYYVVKNTDGSHTTGSVTVTVNTNPLVAIIRQPVSGAVVRTGDNVSVPMSVSGTVQTYQWYKNGNALPGQVLPTLSLFNTTPADAGSYSVVVTGACASVTSTAFSLSLSNPAPVSVCAGSSVNLSSLITPPAGSTVTWSQKPQATAIDAGESYGLALLSNGAVVGWGGNPYGQTSVPASATPAIAISAGEAHALALLANGSIVGWGANNNGQITVPASATPATAISAGPSNSMALLPNGSVVYWRGLTTVLVPATPAIAISSGNAGILALLADGSVVGVGGSITPVLAMPATAISAGETHGLALATNGSIMGWGANGDGQLSVPTSATPAIAVAAGGYFSLALTANGSVVGWGASSGSSVPASATPATAISAGYYMGLALKANGSVVAWGYNVSPGTGYDAQPVASPVVSPTATQTYYYVVKNTDGSRIAGSVTVTTSSLLAISSVSLENCQLTNATTGEYQVRFSPLYCGQNSNPISFSVVNEKLPTTDPAPYQLRLYSDNPTITLVANQSGNPEARYRFNWLVSCASGTSPNRPPTTTGIPSQTLVQNQSFQLTLTDYVTDPDGQSLTFSAQGLPAGLNLTGSLLSGAPSTPGSSTIGITAFDPGGLSVSTSFQLQVTPPPTTSTSFTIVGVSTVNCEALSAGQRRLTFTPQYAGVTAQPISFSVVGQKLPTTDPGPYTLNMYTDNPRITLMAKQDNTMAQYGYEWLAACSGTQPPPANTGPTVASGIGNQSATVNQVYSFAIPAGTFTDAQTPNSLTITVSGLPAGLSFGSGTISGTPSTTGQSSISVTATDPGNLSVSTSFVLSVMAALVNNGTFGISGVTTQNCQTLSAGLRQVTFTPQYTGVSGQPISFSVTNEMNPTTAPGPYNLKLYTDNPAVKLVAQQGTATAQYTYNWLVACSSNGRLGAEPTAALRVTLLGNPVNSESVEVEVSGAVGQGLQLQVIDGQGHHISQASLDAAGALVRTTIGLGQSPGLYLLQVSTSTQSQTVKLIRH